MPSYSNSDLTVFKQQQVRVFSPAGTFLDVWRDAPLLSGFKEAVNSAPQQLVLQLPRRFDNFDESGAGGIGTIGQGNKIEYWLYGPNLPTAGLLRYSGVIDKYAPKVESSGAETLEVTITPYGATIGDVGVINTLQMGSATATTSSTSIAAGTRTITVASASGLVQGAYIPIDTGGSLEYVTITTLSGTSLTATFAKSHSGTYSVGGPMDPVAMFLYWFSAVNGVTSNVWTYPLTLDAGSLTSSGALPIWYTWQNQSLLSIWQTILIMLANDSPNWFFRINPNKTVTLQKTPTMAQNVFTIGQHFPALQYTKDWSNLKNEIVRIGNTTSIVGIATGSDIATFGQRTDMASDTRITTTAQANTLASGTLAIKDQVQYRGVYTVVDFRGDSQVGLGYDIETLQVGQSVQILNPTAPSGGTGDGVWDTSLWDYANWGIGVQDSSQNQVVQLVGLSYNFDIVVMELSQFSPSQDRALAQLALALNDFSVIP